MYLVIQEPAYDIKFGAYRRNSLGVVFPLDGFNW